MISCEISRTLPKDVLLAYHILCWCVDSEHWLMLWPSYRRFALLFSCAIQVLALSRIPSLITRWFPLYLTLDMLSGFLDCQSQEHLYGWKFVGSFYSFSANLWVSFLGVFDTWAFLHLKKNLLNVINTTQRFKKQKSISHHLANIEYSTLPSNKLQKRYLLIYWNLFV